MNKCRCKMCGNIIDISTKADSYKCEVCNYDNIIDYEHVDLIFNLFDKAIYLISLSSFDKALSLIEDILNLDYDNVYAYFLSLMCDFKVNTEDNLFKTNEDITSNLNYILVNKLANDYMKNKMSNLVIANLNYKDKLIKEEKCNSALILINEKKYNQAIKILTEIKDYQRASDLLDNLSIKIKNEQEKKYLKAKGYLEKCRYNEALDLLHEIEGYKDVNELIKEYSPIREIDNYYVQYVSLLDANKKNKKFLLRAIKFFEDNINYRDSKKYYEELKLIYKRKKKFVENICVISIIIVCASVGAAGISTLAMKSINKNSKINNIIANINNDKLAEARDKLDKIDNKNLKTQLNKVIDGIELLKQNEIESACSLINDNYATININVDLDGGKTSSPTSFTYVPNILNEINVEKDGYDFIKWNVVDYKLYKNHKFDLSLNAKYIKNNDVEYKIISHFENFNGGYDKQIVDVYYGSYKETIKVIHKEYKGFTCISNPKPIVLEYDKENIVDLYYTRDVYDVVFVLNNGENNVTKQYKYEADIYYFPTRKNYKFVSWCKDVNQSNRVTKATETKLYALWDKETPAHHFYFDNKGRITGSNLLETDGFVYIPGYYEGKKINEIYNYAFYQNKLITSLYLGDNVTNIGEKVFYDCPNIKKIFIPLNVINIGSFAFSNLDATIYCEATSSLSSWDENWNYNTSNIVYNSSYEDFLKA